MTSALPAPEAETGDGAPGPIPRRRVLRWLPTIAVGAAAMLVLAGCGGEGDEDDEEEDDD